MSVEATIAGSYVCLYKEGAKAMYLEQPRPHATIVVAGKRVRLYVGDDCKADATISRLKDSQFFLYDDHVLAIYSEKMTSRIAAAHPRIHAAYGHGIQNASFFYLVESDAAGRTALREALRATFADEVGRAKRNGKKGVEVAAKFPRSLFLL